MARFKENELNEKLKEFQKADKIEIEFEKSIDGKLVLEGATIEYDYNTGFINIKSKIGTLKINTALVYRYEMINNEIQITLEDMVIKIGK